MTRKSCEYCSNSASIRTCHKKSGMTTCSNRLPIRRQLATGLLQQKKVGLTRVCDRGEILCFSGRWSGIGSPAHDMGFRAVMCVPSEDVGRAGVHCFFAKAVNGYYLFPLALMGTGVFTGLLTEGKQRKRPITRPPRILSTVCERSAGCQKTHWAGLLQPKRLQKPCSPRHTDVSGYDRIRRKCGMTWDRVISVVTATTSGVEGSQA